MIVRTDKTYRLEQVDTLSGGTSQVFEGALDELTMKELTAIIEDSEFVALPNSAEGAGFQFHQIGPDGQIVLVEVHRGNRVQRLSFVDQMGKTQVPRAVKSLLNWVRQFKPQKSDRIKGAKPVLCPLAR